MPPEHLRTDPIGQFQPEQTPILYRNFSKCYLDVISSSHRLPATGRGANDRKEKEIILGLGNLFELRLSLEMIQ